jgi:excisionase family DNA binding protein
VGEQRPERDHEPWLTLAQAAEVLGLSKDAIRMRVRRGTLRYEKGEDGKAYVFRTDLDVDQDAPRPKGSVEGSTAELVEVLRAQVEDLQRRLDRETDANRENRRIIAALTSRIPAIEAPSEPRESSETATEAEAEPRPGGQEGAQRPWWRRWFGA